MEFLIAFCFYCQFILKLAEIKSFPHLEVLEKWIDFNVPINLLGNRMGALIFLNRHRMWRSMTQIQFDTQTLVDK